MKQFFMHDIADTKDFPINFNSPFSEDKHGKGKGGGGEREEERRGKKAENQYVVCMHRR